MAQKVLTISAGGIPTEAANAGDFGFTPVNKAGDTGVGNISMGALTAARVNLPDAGYMTNASGTVFFGDATGLVTGGGIQYAAVRGGSGVVLSAGATQLFLINSSSATFGALPVSMGALTATTVTANSTYGLTLGSIASTRRIQYGSDAATAFSMLTDTNGYAGLYMGALTATTVKVTSAGGYISSDNSTGITTTVTTASLVGKTITIKDGIITGFA